MVRVRQRRAAATTHGGQPHEKEDEMTESGMSAGQDTEAMWGRQSHRAAVTATPGRRLRVELPEK